MNRARIGSLAIASFLLLTGAPGLARADETCTTPRCQNPTEIEEMRTRIAVECDCAGATNPAAYMRCAKRVLGAAIAEGSFPRTCKSAVTGCERALGCGRGIRPFRAVQEAIFTPSCALPSCHSVLARQGGLVLETEDVSYASLVNRPATLAIAGGGGGAMLVKPGEPRNSVLVQKLRGTAPGDQMPQGGRPLSKSTIKLVEKWIRRGAKTTAEECPPGDAGGKRRGGKACNDRPLRTGNFVWQPLPALEAPAPGTGIQMYTPPRDVVPGTEWETCYAFKGIDWPGLAAQLGYPLDPQTGKIQLPVISQQTYRMHEGSHHLLLYAYFGAYPEQWADGYFPCFAGNCDEGNPNDCPIDSDLMIPIGGTQVAGTRYEVRYPQGVGIPVLSDTMVLVANLHYTNPFQPQQPIYGESWLNLYLYKAGEFKVLLDGIFAINARDLFVEPFTSRTISRIWQPRGLLTRDNVDAAVFQLFGHMHKRGVEFQIDLVKDGKCSVSGALCGRDADCACRPYERTCQAGQTCVKGPSAEDSPIYYTRSWDQAPVVDYQKPYLRVNKDQGLRWTCTHTNGVEGDPTRPPKRCHEGCRSCGWDAATRTCNFTRGAAQGFQPAPRVYQLGEPMPIVFGELADDDMCNMFGYFIKQEDVARLP